MSAPNPYLQLATVELDEPAVWEEEALPDQGSGERCAPPLELMSHGSCMPGSCADLLVVREAAPCQRYWRTCLSMHNTSYHIQLRSCSLLQFALDNTGD